MNRHHGMVGIGHNEVYVAGGLDVRASTLVGQRHAGIRMVSTSAQNVLYASMKDVSAVANVLLSMHFTNVSSITG